MLIISKGMKKSNKSVLIAALVCCAALIASSGCNTGGDQDRDPGRVQAAGFAFGLPARLLDEEYNVQPEVNDPPKFESMDVDFPVTEGNLPGIDTDKPRTCARTPVKVTFLVVDPDGDKVTVFVDLDGDDKFDDFKKTTKSGKAVVMKKTFPDLGPVLVKYKACDVKKLCTAVLKFKIEMVNCPPKLVEFATGTERVDVGDKITMKLRASDAQNDKVRYEIDWDDDGEYEHVTPYYPPKKRITVTHAFKESGAHVISARVCDQMDGCSEVERRTVIVQHYEKE
jgi:hypothetical protein